MYCLTVAYPKSEGTHFDLDYYRQTHIPLCARREQLQAALAAAGQEVSADLVNYTDARPRMSFAEISLDIN